MHADELVRIHHMLEAARQAVGFAQGRSRSELVPNPMLALALVRCIEIIGEAATHVGERTRRQFSQIPWDNIVGMRNRIVHTYFDINLDIVWATVTNDLPPLIAELEKIVPPGR